VDPSILHRAYSDVKLIGMLFKKGGYTLEKIIAYRDEPWVYLKADIPKPWEDNEVGKKQAQERGYAWQRARGHVGPEFHKTWVKRIKESALAKEKELSCPFKRIVLRESTSKEGKNDEQS